MQWYQQRHPDSQYQPLLLLLSTPTVENKGDLKGLLKYGFLFLNWKWNRKPNYFRAPTINDIIIESQERKESWTEKHGWSLFLPHMSIHPDQPLAMHPECTKKEKKK